MGSRDKVTGWWNVELLTTQRDDEVTDEELLGLKGVFPEADVTRQRQRCMQTRSLATRICPRCGHPCKAQLPVRSSSATH